MFSSVPKRIDRLLASDGGAALRGGLVGLEKESLRVSPQGTISQRPHPDALGSALAHPHITTDYSEALLELITPPMTDRAEALAFLRDAHRFVYSNLDGELLWATSMPCVLAGGADIPIARYGASNAGVMKTVYRRGLGLRYGRTMQVIAGVHFNYSLADAFWPLYRELEGSTLPLQDFIDESYMGMIRNIQRLGWIVPYLFGASPAVCKSFLEGRPTDMADFNESTYYYPFATSLRMGDIGYQNSLEEGRGFKAKYDSLDTYVRSLTWGIETPCPDYEKIGLIEDGEHLQLSVNVLQIENEHYGTIRPKQITEWMEKPTLALRRRGIRYVELRSLDVNAFHPLGISEQQLYFLELLLVFCLLSESPRIGPRETKTIDANQVLVAHRGREPELLLHRGDAQVRLRDWATQVLEHMLPLARAFDGEDPARPYARSVETNLRLVEDPEQTPSARMLEAMREHEEGFFDFARRLSQRHRESFLAQPLSAEREALFRREAIRSRERQREIELQPEKPFDEFLRDYLTQRA